MGKSLLGEVVSALYQGSRILGKAASNTNTIKTVLIGDPGKIAKHFARKAIYKKGSELTNKIGRKIK